MLLIIFYIFQYVWEEQVCDTKGWRHFPNANFWPITWTFGQQLETLARFTKELKDDMDSMKQHISGVDRRGNTV
jgi:hypothetical protein